MIKVITNYYGVRSIPVEDIEMTRRIDEVTMDLNHINLYSIHDFFHLTICTGNQLDKIKNIQNTERRKKKVMYGHLASYDK